MRLFISLSMLLFAFSNTAVAQLVSADEPINDEKYLDIVAVTGETPGPGLWRVSNGNNILWIMGTVRPLPKDMQWKSAEVMETLNRVNVVIAPPSVKANISTADALKIAMLARPATKAMKIPNGKSLQSMLASDDYLKWLLLRNKYSLDPKKTDTLRPMFASIELYYAAISDVGLSRSDVIWKLIEKKSKDNKLVIIKTEIEFPLTLNYEKYKTGIKALSNSEIDDLSCFNKTTNELEGELEILNKIASSWAVGDIDELARLRFSDVQPPCKSVYDSVMGFQQHKQSALTSQMKARWLAVAENALSTNAETLAVLPLRDMLEIGGYLETLALNGYKVSSPDEIYIEHND